MKPTLRNYQRVIKRIEAMERSIPKSRHITVEVGYAQPYAMIVHESEEMEHKHGGQSAFLLSVRKEFERLLSETVKRVFVRTKDISQALLVAGNQLKRLAQGRTPVDTGALRMSAWVGLEGTDAQIEKETAFAKSEVRRIAVQERRKAIRHRKREKRREKWRNQ